MKSPTRVDLIASSEDGAWIVCPAALKAAAADPNYFESGKDCGTGPYMLKSYTAGKQVVLTRYDNYWGGWTGNRFSNVVIEITPEAIVQQQMLTSGQVDLALSVPLENVKQLTASGKYSLLVRQTVPQLRRLLQHDAAAARQRPRPAGARRMRRPTRTSSASAPLATAARPAGPVPFGIFPWSATTPQYTTNIAKAKALLAQSGQASGFSMTLTYAAENQDEARYAPLIKDAYAKIGVKVTLKPILFNQQWAVAKGDPKKAQDMFLLQYWPTYSDAGVGQPVVALPQQREAVLQPELLEEPRLRQARRHRSGDHGDIGHEGAGALRARRCRCSTTRRRACTCTT